MSNPPYPPPILLTDADRDTVLLLLERDIEGVLKTADVSSFFSARGHQALHPLPVNPRAGGKPYGHWKTADGTVEVFAHMPESGKFIVHAITGGSLLIPLPDYQGAIWAAPSGDMVEFTAIGIPDDAFAGFSYRTPSIGRDAIDHQITEHVPGRCRHDHKKDAPYPR